MNIVIYGAQAIALGAYKTIKELSPERTVSCFLVTKMKDNPPTLCDVPVLELAVFAAGLTREEKENIEVLIATPESVMESIEQSLEEVGLRYHVRLNSVRWAQMQQLLFVRKEQFAPLATFPLGIHRPNIQVYKAKFYKDKKLSTEYIYPEYMIDLQVGAAKTDVQVAKLLDNIGDNISERNGNYSELTGLYWLWKNQLCVNGCKQEQYYGLAHYRRFLELSEDDLSRILGNDIDVVLPYPMPYEPSIEAHHERYLSESEWNAVLRALEELQPEYAEAFKEILKQEYMYNYNIILAKGDVLDAYCYWLFSILFRVEELNNLDGTKVPNRYIGYVGETLETLYFMYNKDKLRIAHAGCRFLL